MTERILCPFCRFTEWFYAAATDLIQRHNWPVWGYVTLPALAFAYVSSDAVVGYFGGILLGSLLTLIVLMDKKSERETRGK
tara:strand:- start:351 stop:593 length:243 start_codon:yes stop_codon:yes gene_type:complete